MTRVLLLLIFNLSISALLAQTITPVPPTSNHLGYLEYLPPDYSSTTENYPCIIFLHGSGEIGNGLEPDIWKVALLGPLREVKVNKHTMCFTVNGKQECFIVIAPQAPYVGAFSGTDFQNLYNHILNSYRIDSERIYVTGLSYGGQTSFTWAASDQNSTNKIAALGIMSGMTDCTTAQKVGAKNIPIWWHHGDADNTPWTSYAKALTILDCINSVNPNPPPIFTVYPGLGHSATLWNQAYSTSHTYNNPNLYEWFLSYRLNGSVKVDLGSDKSVTLPTNSINLTSTINSANPITNCAWTKQSGPAATLVNASTSTLTANSLVQGTYVFRLTVKDNQGNTGYDEVTVTVLPEVVNQAPIANAGVDQTIALPTDLTVFKGSGSDSDGSIISYAWTKISGPSVTMQNLNTASLTVLGLTVGSYVFRLTVTDDDGATGTDQVSLTVVGAANNAPSVNAGPDKTVQLPTITVVLSGTASDEDGSIAKYHWIQQSGPTATLQDIYTPNLTVTDLLQGTYVFRLWAKDDDDATAWDDATVVVQAVNQAPVANAGADQNLKLPVSNTTVKGSGSDTDGSIASYSWMKVSGPSATMTNVSNATLSLSNLLTGTYTFGLTVTDDDGATGYDEVKITVDAANVVPLANAGDDVVLYLPTNSATIKGISSDADGSIASYQWVKKSGPGVTLTNANSASLTISNLVEGTYTFTFTVTDNEGAKATDEVSVFVLVSNSPPTANAGANQNITLPTNTLNLSGSGTDSDGSIVSYNWVKVSGPSVTMTNTTSSTLRLSNLISGTYVFGLTVTDDDGATGYDEVIVVVSPEPVNIAPSANAGSDIAITLPTNQVNLSCTANDPDGSISSYLWEKVSGPSATIGSANSANTTASNLVAGSYVFRVTVTDNDGATASDNVNVTVYEQNINQNPVVDAGSTITIRLPLNTATFNPTISDDGTIVSYEWAQITGPNTSAFNNFSIEKPTVSGLIAGVYSFRLTVTDDGGASASDDVTVNVAEANQAPVVNAGSDIIIQLPDNSVTITANANDPDGGSIVSYLWTRISGPNGETISGSNTATAVVTNLSEGIYVFQTEVADNEGATATDRVKVTVQAENKIPLANAGNDVQIRLPVNSANLNGAGSDADGSIVSYEWSKESGPMVTMVNQNSATLTLSDLVEGTYVFRLTVTDNDGASNFDDITVTVLPELANALPVANAGPDKQVTLPTNTLACNGSGTDSDGSIVSYSWIKISGPSATLANANTATLTVSGLATGVYTFRLTVTDDDGATASDEVQIIVNPTIVNQNPVADAGSDQNITLPTNSLNIVGSASDADGTIVSYLWEKISGPSVSVTNENNNVLVLTNLMAGTYSFKLTVTDDDGATSSDIANVVVNPEDTNQPPIANAGPNISVSLPTNTVVLNGSGSDANGSIVSYNWQKISGPSVTLANSDNATLTATSLVEGTYIFRLTVTDNNNATGTDEVRVIVVGANVNSNPVVSAGNDIMMQLPTNSAIIQADASDRDGSIVSYQWEQISGSPSNMSDQALATLTVTDLAAGTYRYRITVTDDDGASDFDEINVLVEAEDVNIAPIADAGENLQIFMPTNSAVIDGKGSDVDGTIISYNWIKTSGPSVTMTNPDKATLSLSEMLEGEYTFRLTVNDNDGGTGQDEIKIFVFPDAVNQSPVSNAGDDIELYLPENNVELFGGGNDFDGEIVAYEWEQVSGPSATIEDLNTSILSLSGLTIGAYKFKLAVTDNEGATGTDYVLINVYSEGTNILPSVDLGNNIIEYLPLDSLAITGIASDPNGEITNYTWSKLSGANVTFEEIDSILVIRNIVSGTYIFRLSVTDNDGATAFDDIVVTINPEGTNRNPQSNAGSDSYITLPDNTITIFGSGSDPDGDAITYEWSQLSGPSVIALEGIDNAELHLSELVEGTYVFELLVTDEKGATSSDRVTLVVNPENIPPTADAGEDIILTSPVDNYVHVGNGIDEDGYILSYEWRLISGPVIDNSVIYSDTLILDGLMQGEYLYELSVMDNDSTIATDAILIQIFPGDLSELGAHKIFSPDGNGIDDYWEIDNLDMISGCQLTIFNRFGLKVYESNNYQNEWGGTFNGSSLPDGDYYFIIKCGDGSDDTSGGIRIIRDY
jgi:gliding motility-associated-like protein